MATETWKKIKIAYIYWLARRLPACDEILPLISQQMDRPLPLKQKFNLILHNHICELCKRYANQLLLLRQAVRAHAADPEVQTTTDTTLSFEARERLKRSLHE
jgi:hypothetical protein